MPVTRRILLRKAEQVPIGELPDQSGGDSDPAPESGAGSDSRGAQPGKCPVATGRAGSRIHSLHEPG